MPKLVGRVRWLKAMEGGCDLPMLGAAVRVRKSMEAMGNRIAGGDDVVATYIIRRKPRAQYNDGSFRRGRIAGILWLSPMPKGETVNDHREDGNYEIGWPVADRDLTEGPDLKQLVHEVYGPDAGTIWPRLPVSMQGGRPIQIDVPTYQALSDALTDYYRR